MAIRSSSARWEGTLTEGTGTMRTGQGGYQGNYSFKSRFADGEGTNPEELIGAAHAGCYSMALNAALSAAGHQPTFVESTANVHLDKVDDKQTIVKIDLVTTATVPGLDAAEFQKFAEDAKQNCIISRLLSAGTEITLSATLV